MKMTPLTRSCL